MQFTDLARRKSEDGFGNAYRSCAQGNTLPMTLVMVKMCHNVRNKIDELR